MSHRPVPWGKKKTQPKTNKQQQQQKTNKKGHSHTKSFPQVLGWQRGLFEQQGWVRWLPEVLSNLTHSVILCMATSSLAWFEWASALTLKMEKLLVMEVCWYMWSLCTISFHLPQNHMDFAKCMKHNERWEVNTSNMPTAQIKSWALSDSVNIYVDYVSWRVQVTGKWSFPFFRLVFLHVLHVLLWLDSRPFKMSSLCPSSAYFLI